GVNQRRSKWPGCWTRNAVSDRFISRATAWSHWSSLQDGSRQTAAGLPAKGRSVKASTWKRGMFMDSFTNDKIDSIRLLPTGYHWPGREATEKVRHQDASPSPVETGGREGVG